MAADLRLVREARIEYQNAIRYYASEASSPDVARRFLQAMEAGMAAVRAAPEMWRIVEPPDVRRYVLQQFPYVLYYRFFRAENLGIIYAFMHTSRDDGYWRDRLQS